jgi:aspartyl-tRNA(Asn)/glutamyl-tRNA(Gln) amidotransferase subunit C
MKINNKSLDKIASLAKLKIKDEERAVLINDMSAILDWVEKLNEVDTSNVKPITQMTHEINRFRSDDKEQNITAEEATSNSSTATDNFFVVPKVIKK